MPGTTPPQYRTDPDGNANEVKLRKPKVVRAQREGDFFGFGGPGASRGGGGGRRGGGGGGAFNWLFR